ncbi:BZ3500_MvSof-1268-A1-R1_Chr1-1g00866 [Microbotryum saponariae]|uniref:BZ3500_MvSof-1268-A1-R1_Chr1-1g00866 protein n=1 Tax=Microbotryum saponariae TaxID=289078 RepID=A0A2X0MF87_9BASI|nr:BZ3500_MvSof-1268-A1-R1_Chr1-1g00866 [Microbotryum saponariae]SCZ92810.1 BZ3501_MvSof-1269-A2-R1_Chr1-1g00463 [Microbotryum saponariae]
MSCFPHYNPTSSSSPSSSSHRAPPTSGTAPSASLMAAPSILSPLATSSFHRNDLLHTTHSGASTTTLASTQSALPLELQSVCVIGGGTGCNAILGAFGAAHKISYVVPISDDGGSSSEIQRVLGQSRLVRLIPESSPNSPLFAIRRLLEHRLGDNDSIQVKAEWHSIVEAKHPLWQGIPNDRKETIRAFLIHVEAAILRKARRGFSYKRASIGNLFVAGAQLFLGSIPSAIFLFASITDIPHDKVRVVPVINTASTATIAAELEDGTIIPGQSDISHPSQSSLSQPARPSTPSFLAPNLPAPVRIPPSPGAAISHPLNISRVPTPALLFEARTLGDEEEDDDDPSGQGQDGSKNPNVGFSKDEIIPLQSRIKRILYLNSFGSEIYPRANPLFLESLKTSTCLIYSPGSLYTSIIPCLALRNVGPSIVDSPTLKYKILLLNSRLDRESAGYDAGDFVRAIQGACAEPYGEEGRGLRRIEVREVVSHLVYVEEGEVRVDREEMEAFGIICVPVRTPSRLFDEAVVAGALSNIFAEER